VNLDLRVAPQSGPPETECIDRGDTSRALNVLPEGSGYAVALGPETFARLSNDLWDRSLSEVDESGSITHLVRDENGNVRGSFKSAGVATNDGRITTSALSEIEVPDWFSADVTAIYDTVPALADGVLHFDTRLALPDADTGLLGDFVGFLLGSVFGIGMLGIAVVEFYELYAEREEWQHVEEEGQRRAPGAFDPLPSMVRMFPAIEDDPLHDRFFDVMFHHDAVQLDPDGMSIAGHGAAVTVDEPLPAAIIGKSRDHYSLALESLTYLAPLLLPRKSQCPPELGLQCLRPCGIISAGASR
jgi:hypothetical protein